MPPVICAFTCVRRGGVRCGSLSTSRARCGADRVKARRIDSALAWWVGDTARDRGGAVQDYESGRVGFIHSSNWQLPAPWAPPVPGAAGHELFQWRFKNVSVTCEPGGTAIERMAALPRPARAPPSVAAADAYCYHPDDRGESYRGPIAWSESRRPCVPWGRLRQPAGANVLSQQYLPDSCDSPMLAASCMHEVHAQVHWWKLCARVSSTIAWESGRRRFYRLLLGFPSNDAVIGPTRSFGCRVNALPLTLVARCQLPLPHRRFPGYRWEVVFAVPKAHIPDRTANRPLISPTMAIMCKRVAGDIIHLLLLLGVCTCRTAGDRVQGPGRRRLPEPPGHV